MASSFSDLTGYLPSEAGREFEERAARFLGRFGGMRLVARNYRCKMGELDLVYEERRPEGSDELVFVEVRCRRGFLKGSESVGWRKRARLSRAIRHFLVRYRGPAATLRVDVLSWDGRSWEWRKNIGLETGYCKNY